jgi:hypothetical protein
LAILTLTAGLVLDQNIYAFMKAGKSSKKEQKRTIPSKEEGWVLISVFEVFGFVALNEAFNSLGPLFLHL